MSQIVSDEKRSRRFVSDRGASRWRLGMGGRIRSILLQCCRRRNHLLFWHAHERHGEHVPRIGIQGDNSRIAFKRILFDRR